MGPISWQDHELLVHALELQLAREPEGSERRVYLLDQIHLAQFGVSVEGRHIQVLTPSETDEPQTQHGSLEVAESVASVVQSILDGEEEIREGFPVVTEEFLEVFANEVEKRFEEQWEEAKRGQEWNRRKIAALTQQAERIKQKLDEMEKTSAAEKEASRKRWENALSEQEATTQRWKEVTSKHESTTEIWKEVASKYEAITEIWKEVTSKHESTTEIWKEVASKYEAITEIWKEVASKYEAATEIWKEITRQREATTERWKEVASKYEEMIQRMKNKEKEIEAAAAEIVAYVINAVEISLEYDLIGEQAFFKHGYRTRVSTREELLDKDFGGMKRGDFLVQLKDQQARLGPPVTPLDLIEVSSLKEPEFIDIEEIKRQVWGKDYPYSKESALRKKIALFVPHWLKLLWIFSFGMSFYFLRKKPLRNILPFFSAMFLWQGVGRACGKFSVYCLNIYAKGAETSDETPFGDESTEIDP